MFDICIIILIQGVMTNVSKTGNTKSLRGFIMMFHTLSHDVQTQAQSCRTSC